MFLCFYVFCIFLFTLNCPFAVGVPYIYIYIYIYGIQKNHKHIYGMVVISFFCLVGLLVMVFLCVVCVLLDFESGK